MEALAWRADLATGFPEIDSDHKSLFDYLDVLEAAVRDNQGREKSKAVLDGLLDYTKSHFAREEAIFTKQPGYSLCAIHLQQHQHFVTELEKFRDQLSNDADISSDMAAFLSKWLTRHIMTVDKVFFDLFERHPEIAREHVVH